MIIKDKVCVVFDVEVLNNVFTCTCKNTETGIINVFEISPRNNHIDNLYEFFKQDYCFVGYNNLHYDNPVLNYIFELRQLGYFKRYELKEINASIFRMSQQIIDKDTDIRTWKKYKYATRFFTVDLLTMLYSTALRVSLKEMQITMQYKNVEEFVVDWHKDLPVEDIDRLIAYNINDVESTEELLNRCKGDLDLRVAIENEYHINCLSVDGVNTGMKILEEEYIKHTGINRAKLESLRSPCEQIDLEKVIFPWISFTTPQLQNILNEMKSLHDVSPTRKGYENTFLFGSMKVTIGVGGIHGDCGACIIKPKDDEMLIDEDINSLYPSMIIEHNLYPPHLGKAFIETYANIKAERMEAKKTKNKLKDKTLKLSLNGLSGNLQNENSWCYSPFTVMQVRINGQLLLLKYAENLFNLGCKLKQINTDGVLYICKKEMRPEILKMRLEWEKQTRLTFEAEEFTAFYQLAINDYFGVEKDEIKKKGFFLTDITLGKGLSPKIIPEAIINYFVYKVPVAETIKSCRDIRKFLQGEKTGKQWTVEYNNIVQQRTNRFYASTNGYYLWKWKYDETGNRQYQIMLKDSAVTLHNTFYSDEDLQWKYAQGFTFEDIYHINYQYYISQCSKIIEQLEPKQLNLFDFNEL